jgi:dopamine beta-monooxygenase
MLVRVVLFLFCFCSVASAFSIYGPRIPNGAEVPNNSCGACHLNPNGSSPPQLVQFGLDFSAAGSSWTAALSALDSDGDGFSNGEELLDPSGSWTQGQPDPGDPVDVTNPGDATDFPTIAQVPALTSQGLFILASILVVSGVHAWRSSSQRA